jgi:DNA (cytosine-5)-methyltransferase 1
MNSTRESRPRKLCFIDLFCGCGGFSLGLHRAGFRCLAALDSDPAAIETFRKNLPEIPHILERDLTKYPASELARLLGNARPDLIAGGPPCQGFSTARQRDGANHGTKRLIADDRRQLYKQFLAYVVSAMIFIRRTSSSICRGHPIISVRKRFLVDSI